MALAALLTLALFASTRSRRPIDTEDQDDDAEPALLELRELVPNSASPMSSFKGQLSSTQIRAVAAYVTAVAGK